MPFNIKKLSIDRQNFGLDKFTYHRFVTKWRLSDIIYIFFSFTLDWVYFETIQPYQRQFTINDITISHPFAIHERVPGDTLLLWTFTIPTATMFIVTFLLTPRKYKIYVTFISFVGLFVSLGTCIFITDVLKNWIGRCRPDFLARCVPRSDALPDVLYYGSEVCTTKDIPMLMDGYRTTPSGHSSMSFAAFGYLTFWLLGQLTCYHIHGGAWRSIIAILPSLLASYVALSRTQDYRHHFVDIILGSLLGLSIAFWSYRRLFPSVTDNACYVPYILIDETESGENNYFSHDYYDDVELSENNYVATGNGHGDLESQNLDSFH